MTVREQILRYKKKTGLTRKWLPESRTSACAISRRDITALNHELRTSQVNPLNRDTEKGRTSGMIL
jgi:hypothetical protein